MLLMLLLQLMLPPQIVAAGGPAAERPAGAEGKPGRDQAGADVAGSRPVVRRIGRIGPSAVDHGGIVVRHVDGVGGGRLDHDHLLATLLLDRDRLLLGRRQLVVGLRLRAQPLDRVHDVRLLRQHRVAELLRPIELRAHHREHVRRRRPAISRSRPTSACRPRLSASPLRFLFCLGPAVRLHDLERIGRRHQDLGQRRPGTARWARPALRAPRA